MSYLQDIEFAVERIITTVYEERRVRDELQAELDAALNRLKWETDRRDFLVMNPDLDDEGLGTMAHWDIHFDHAPRADKAQRSVDDINNSIAAKQFSVDAMSGSILQYAKQGISITHGSLAACPDGRHLGTQTLKNIIWQARNQAMHFEDQNPHPPVVACFTALANDTGNPRFSAFRTDNLGFDVLEHLGWRTIADFNADMRLLGIN